MFIKFVIRFLFVCPFVCLFVFFLSFVFFSFTSICISIFLFNFSFSFLFLLFSLAPLPFILLSIFLISILDFIYLLIFISVLYIYLFFSSLLPCLPCGWLVAEQSRPSRSVFCCRHACREVNDWVDQMHIPLIHLLWGFTYHTTTYACTSNIQGSTIVPLRTFDF